LVCYAARSRQPRGLEAIVNRGGQVATAIEPQVMVAAGAEPSGPSPPNRGNPVQEADISGRALGGARQI